MSIEKRSQFSPRQAPRACRSIVEISVAFFQVLVAFIVIGIFLFRIRERLSTRSTCRPLDRFPGAKRLMNLGGARSCWSSCSSSRRWRRRSFALLTNYRIAGAAQCAGDDADLHFRARTSDSCRDTRRGLLSHRTISNIVFNHLEHVRRLHHQRLQHRLHRARARDRPALTPVYLRFYPRHVSGCWMFCNESSRLIANIHRT